MFLTHKIIWYKNYSLLQAKWKVLIFVYTIALVSSGIFTVIGDAVLSYAIFFMMTMYT